MSILKDNIFPEPLPIVKENKLKMVANSIRELSTITFNKIINTQRKGIDLVWYDPDLTPQEIIDYLGSDAIKIFQFHAALTTFIQELANIDNVDVDLKQPTHSFNITPEGVITVTDSSFVS